MKDIETNEEITAVSDILSKIDMSSYDKATIMDIVENSRRTIQEYEIEKSEFIAFLKGKFGEDRFEELTKEFIENRFSGR